MATYIYRAIKSALLSLAISSSASAAWLELPGGIDPFYAYRGRLPYVTNLWALYSDRVYTNTNATVTIIVSNSVKEFITPLPYDTNQVEVANCGLFAKDLRSFSVFLAIEERQQAIDCSRGPVFKYYRYDRANLIEALLWIGRNYGSFVQHLPAGQTNAMVWTNKAELCVAANVHTNFLCDDPRDDRQYNDTNSPSYITHRQIADTIWNTNRLYDQGWVGVKNMLTNLTLLIEPFALFVQKTETFLSSCSNETTNIGFCVVSREVILDEWSYGYWDEYSGAFGSFTIGVVEEDGPFGACSPALIVSPPCYPFSMTIREGKQWSDFWPYVVYSGNPNTRYDLYLAVDTNVFFLDQTFGGAAVSYSNLPYINSYSSEWFDAACEECARLEDKGISPPICWSNLSEWCSELNWVVGSKITTKMAIPEYGQYDYSVYSTVDGYEYCFHSHSNNYADTGGDIWPSDCTGCGSNYYGEIPNPIWRDYDITACYTSVFTRATVIKDPRFVFR